MYTIYMAQVQGAEGPVKIGLTSGDPAARMSELQVASPWEVSLIRLIPGPRILERALQHRFADNRMRGEWFRFDASMLTISVDETIEAYRPTVHRWKRRRLSRRPAAGLVRSAIGRTCRVEP